MHPYRPLVSLAPHPAVPTDEPGLRLSFVVMTLVSAVQVVSAVADSRPGALSTLFGGACFLTGASWLLRHRRR